MALTDAFLATCTTAINSLSELTTFRSALALTEHTRAGRQAAYNRAFGSLTSSPSPAYNLAKAIRDTVNAQADAAGTMSPLERESAYRSMVEIFVPDINRPPSDADEAAAVEALIREDQLS